LAIWHQFTKYKGIKVADASELQALYNACHQQVGTVIVQEWIVGSTAELYSCNLYMDVNSEPLATFVARKLRQWPPDVGSSSSGEECHNEEVLKLAVDLFQSTRCRGLAYLEVKRDVRTGRHVIIEPNIGRPTGRSPIAEAGGVELIYTMYCDALGLPLPRNRKQAYGGVKWIYLRWDIQSALVHLWRRELTFADWYRSLRGKKAYALFSWNDPGPFIWDLWATTVKAASTLLFPDKKPKSKVKL
jgi:predicted ATP-grasp superfamily ATP-dependent carboligase